MPPCEGQSDLGVTEETLTGISAFGGLVGVEGQGIRIMAEGSFDPIAVNDLIHELRNAGAEAIAIDEIRITAASVAVLGTSAIEIDGVPIGPTFEIRAIGSPDGLQAAIERPGRHPQPVRAVDRRPLHRAPGGPAGRACHGARPHAGGGAAGRVACCASTTTEPA